MFPAVTWNNRRRTLIFLFTYEHHRDRMPISILLIIYSCIHISASWMYRVHKKTRIIGYKWKICTNRFFFYQWQIYCDNASWYSIWSWSLPSAVNARKMRNLRTCVICFDSCWEILIIDLVGYMVIHINFAMITPWHGEAFRITCSLWELTIGHQWRMHWGPTGKSRDSHFLTSLLNFWTRVFKW